MLSPLRNTCDKIRNLVPANRKTKKLDNNTYARREEDGTTAIKLHETDIITVHPNHTITITTGGWQTVTTKERLNSYLFGYVRIWQEHGFWFLSEPLGGSTIPWQDGILLSRKKIKAVADKVTTAKQRFRKQIFAYCKAFVEKLQAGEIEAPGPGDCLLCRMTKTIGESATDDHIQSHIEEKYYVPRLLHNAVEAGGVSHMAKACIQAKWDKTEPPMDNIFLWKQVERTLRRYILHACGYAT